MRAIMPFFLVHSTLRKFISILSPPSRSRIPRVGEPREPFLLGCVTHTDLRRYCSESVQGTVFFSLLILLLLLICCSILLAQRFQDISDDVLARLRGLVLASGFLPFFLLARLGPRSCGQWTSNMWSLAQALGQSWREPEHAQTDDKRL